VLGSVEACLKQKTKRADPIRKMARRAFKKTKKKEKKK